MITAPTGQAVFDPFAPPTVTPPQPMVTEPEPTINVLPAQASSQMLDQDSTQLVNPSDNHQFNSQSAGVDAIIPDQFDQSTDQSNLVTSAQLSDDTSQKLTSTTSNAQILVADTPFTQIPAGDDQVTDQTLDQPSVDQADQQLTQPVGQQDQLDNDQVQDFDLTEDERLALFDQVLTEAEQASSVFDQVMPAAIIANDPLNPQGITTSGARKPETVASNSNVQEAGLIGQVEFEPASELPVEVEGFLERVEDHADKLPQELVVADGNVQALPQSHPTQTVIVLPITAEDEQVPAKDVKLSFTWLLEWSHKIIKKFVGKVVYRHEP